MAFAGREALAAQFRVLWCRIHTALPERFRQRSSTTEKVEKHHYSVADINCAIVVGVVCVKAGWGAAGSFPVT